MADCCVNPSLLRPKMLTLVTQHLRGIRKRDSRKKGRNTETKRIAFESNKFS